MHFYKIQPLLFYNGNVRHKFYYVNYIKLINKIL